MNTFKNNKYLSFVFVVATIMSTFSFNAKAESNVKTECGPSMASKSSNSAFNKESGLPVVLYAGRKAVCDVKTTEVSHWKNIEMRNCQFLNPIEWNKKLDPQFLKAYLPHVGNPNAFPGNLGFNIYGNPIFKNDSINYINHDCAYQIAKKAESKNKKVFVLYEVIQAEVAVPYMNVISIVN